MQKTVLFDYATEQDFLHCRSIVERKLNEWSWELNANIDDLTIRIMKLSYSIGGSYDYNMICSLLNCAHRDPILKLKLFPVQTNENCPKPHYVEA